MTTLTSEERKTIRESLDLRDWGFEKVSAFGYRDTRYFAVTLSEWYIVFSCKRYTTPVDYADIDAYLIEMGYTKDMIGQGEQEQDAA